MLQKWLVLVFALTSVGACSGGGSGGGGGGGGEGPATPSGPGSSSSISPQGPLPEAGPGEVLLQLAWEPNTDGVAGYRVYYGDTAEQATKQASDLAVTAANFNAQTPNVVYNAQRDLGLASGNVCFRLRAYDQSGALSDWSAPACASI